MNKRDKIQWLKKELRDLETFESVQTQSLHAIKSRKKYLKEELHGLGASCSSKVKPALSNAEKAKLLASMTQ